VASAALDRARQRPRERTSLADGLARTSALARRSPSSSRSPDSAPATGRAASELAGHSRRRRRRDPRSARGGADKRGYWPVYPRRAGSSGRHTQPASARALCGCGCSRADRGQTRVRRRRRPSRRSYDVGRLASHLVVSPCAGARDELTWPLVLVASPPPAARRALHRLRPTTRRVAREIRKPSSSAKCDRAGPGGCAICQGSHAARPCSPDRRRRVHTPP
jgi:hypothetical protein